MTDETDENELSEPTDDHDAVAVSVAEPEPDAVDDDIAELPEEPVVEAAAVPPVVDEANAGKNPNFKWYVVKVASGREESIKAAIERRMKIENLEEFVGQIVIPVERVTEVKKVKETKNGEKITKEKRVIKEKKKFPGYLMAQVEFNPDILSLFRDTSGVGDFVGASGPGKPPPPMSDRDVQSMLYGMQGQAGVNKETAAGKLPVKVKLDFEKGDKVRIREGAFASMEGEISVITEPKEPTDTPKVQVIVQIFGRPVSVDLDYWQVDKV